MTSAPSDNDDERTRLAEPADERTRLAEPADERTRQAGPADERTRLVESADERTRIADPAGAETVLLTSAGASTVIPATAAASATPARPPAASSSVSTPHNALDVGTKIGEFEIEGIVGEGGFGIVYLAYDHSLDRKVALKEYMPAQLAQRQGGTVVMRSDRYAETFEAGRRSFINEARLLAQFDHHSLVKVYRFWEANGTAYMVMPFYEGKTLKSALKELDGQPTEDWLKALLAHLLDALEIIHNRQCYHRDIAPDNILILPDETPLLLDFGAARRVIGDMTQALTVILKPGYAPIEQYAEVPNMKQGAWTDLYALASVVYFAVTGKAPVPSVARVMSDPLKPLVETHAGRYSEPFLRAIDWALAVKPESRPQSIAELRPALGLPERESATRYMPASAERTVAVPQRPPSAPPAPAGGSPKAAPSRAGTYALVGGGAAAAVLAAAGYVWFASGDSPEPVKPGEPPVVAAPVPVAAGPELAAQVAEKLAGIQCARLDSKVDGGTAAVRGHVASDGDLQQLRSDLAGIRGVSKVDTAAVQVVPSTYCGVLAALAAHAQPQSGAPSVGLRGGAAAAFEGDKLIVEVTGARFPGLAYVDLYDQEGNVVHLFPNAKDRKNELAAGQQTIIGDVLGQQWDIVPPLGKHLLVVTVSRSKLFERERPEVEPGQKFVGVLQDALKKQPDAVVNYRFVDFAPKR